MTMDFYMSHQALNGLIIYWHFLPSYSPCLMALVIMSVHNLLSRVLSMISGIDVRLSHSTRLSRIFSLDLPLPLLPFSLPVVTMCSILPLLMMCPKNVDCLLLIWLCSCLFELTSFNTSSFRFLSVQGILNILL